ncbi:GNAT family N-acetyltransferase [Clostridium sp. D2Q-11]|uniref:GNAT family N-acetyltransferase n=1 Tax=Anaeromonas frigoriresistens TaxID=2683708 RepID=A0A942UY27_9FIRM|nr:GNAT family N-acetyltransferase [Anaeromonas frigoriresistens]MBS4538924.1 GNAT family N-acetyltransferase [Anaeromonas frigoriresistens]
MNVKYVINGELNAEEIIEVFKSVGWNKNKDIIVPAFKNSYYIMAYYEDELLGFSRAISDNYYYTGIYDVVVKPEYQGRGIAKRMVESLVEEFKGTYFFLTYTEGKRAFYEKCGFEDNSNAMWIPL